MGERVSVRHADFDVSAEVAALRAGDAGVGAIVAFVGTVRDHSGAADISRMELEHYPGMTEASIEDIVNQAAQRWPLLAATVVHRVGKLAAGDQIVWVGVTSAHRAAAFSACEFIMDYLKTRAPFWKKELGPDGEQWVAARQHDSSRAARWREDNAL